MQQKLNLLFILWTKLNFMKYLRMVPDYMSKTNNFDYFYCNQPHESSLNLPHPADIIIYLKTKHGQLPLPIVIN